MMESKIEARQPPAGSRESGKGAKLAAGLTLLLSAGLFLHHLGAQPLQLWDESRLALNALNIGVRHNWLVMYYGHFPDSLNTKPPVVPVLQALAYAAFGVSTGALRLPAAVAGVLTAALLVFFAWKILRKPWVGIVAAMALSTMPGFNGYHVARTGEYDALLALLTTGYCLSAFAWLERPRRRYLLLLGAALAGALLVKCAAALLPLPGLLLYARRYAPAAFRDRRLWRTLAAACGPLLLFYLVRELAYPGYLRFTFRNDWLGRVVRPLTGVTAWWYYLPALGRGLSCWGVALGVGGGLFLRRASPRLPAIAGFGLWQAAFLLLVVSAAQTRLPWYLAPAYPLLALTIGSLAVSFSSQSASLTRWLVPALCGSVALVAGYDTVRQHQAAATAPLTGFEQYGRGLPWLDQLPLPSPAVVLLSESYNPLLDYYRLTAAPPHRLQLDFQRLPDKHPETGVKELLPGQQVFGCRPQYRRLLEQQFQTTPLAALDSCWCLRLDQRRQRQ